MKEGCTLQLFDGAWHDVATVTLFGERRQGWAAKTYTGYATDWSLQHFGARDAYALSCEYPVGLEELQLPHWPVFLIDMLPQGYGRQELLRRLQLSPVADQEADWQLLIAGAGNPIGNLRVKEAAHWLAQHPGNLRGFDDEVVASRAEDFTEYLASHGLFVAGSSGVQGEWPKILLTRAEDGLLYLDHTLPDERAREHYIVKFGRGPNPRLATILRHEAPYMQLATMLGLRVAAGLVFKERALFIPRFDRAVGDGGVVRLAQESVASLCNKAGFGPALSHDEICRQLIARCTRPQEEILEYIKRDVANIALGNKDNHARNTAIQRDFAGNVRLTPLYDFVPMYLHPDGIARRIRWENNDGGSPDWQLVIDRVCELAHTAVAPAKGRRKKTAAAPVLERNSLVAGLREMEAPLRLIAEHGARLGLEPEVADQLRLGILEQADRLASLE